MERGLQKAVRPLRVSSPVSATPATASSSARPLPMPLAAPVMSAAFPCVFSIPMSVAGRGQSSCKCRLLLARLSYVLYTAAGGV